MVDDKALLIGEDGRRCDDCKEVTKNIFLFDDICPDCYKKQNGEVSPALIRYNQWHARASIGCASGEAGEAD